MDRLEWHVVIPPEKEGEIIKVRIAGKAICILRSDGQIYATAARCPHAGADLSTGWCEGRKLVCPYHRHRFDLSTGKGDAGQNNFVPVYPLKAVEGVWYIGFTTSWWRKLF
jgi:nitrite reductase/ring-hydroxylating ferredoxin subunit